MDESSLLSDLSFNADYAIGDSLEGNQGLPTKCEICNNDFSDPVILNCLHIFDSQCLKKYESNNVDALFSLTKCPKCDMTSASVSSLEPFLLTVLENSDTKEGSENDVTPVIKCSLCTSDTIAEYKCSDCDGTLCESCQNVHKVMKMFSSHSVSVLTEAEKKNIAKADKEKPVMCSYHITKPYRFFCFQCHVPICNECATTDHKLHINCDLDEVPGKLEEVIKALITDCQSNHTRLKEDAETLNNLVMDLSTSRDQNRSHIEEVCNDWKAAIDEIKEEFLKRNKEYHDGLELKVLDGIEKTEKTMDHIDYSIDFTESYINRCSPAVMAKLVKTVVSCLEQLGKTRVDTDMITSVQFNEDRGRIREILRREFGWFGDERAHAHASNVAASTALATLSEHTGPVGDIMNGIGVMRLGGSNGSSGGQHHPCTAANMHMGDAGYLGMHHQTIRTLDTSPTESGGSSTMGITSGGLHSLRNGLDLALTSDYTTTSSHSKVFSSLGLDSAGGTPRTGTPGGMPPTLEHSHSLDPSLLASLGISTSGDHGHPSKPSSHSGSGFNPNPNPPFPNRAGRCSVMNVRYRWGSLGAAREQLSSPHGFCLGFDEEIVVADTQNHRIQIFDKTGDFRDQFGVPGREEGQLWYPRKVATLRNSQKYVVCDRGNERSRMQIFTRSGHFIKKVVIRYIDIVAGLAINAYGHIVAVDSVSPTVFVISENGELIRWFDCSDYMKEPSDIAISGRELYICDFKGHCVAVFQEDGTFVRRIGSDAVTNFPNGIDVSDHGDVLVGDSHGNRFHISVFSRQGILASEFECPTVKVSRCCGLKITSEGYVVTLAKNNHHVLVLDTLYVT